MIDPNNLSHFMRWARQKGHYTTFELYANFKAYAKEMNEKEAENA